MIRRPGFTLVELMVVLLVLGIMAGVVGLSIRNRPPTPAVSTIDAQLTELRTRAVTSGRPATILLVTDSIVGQATAYPDGRVLSTVGNVERVTGRPRAQQPQ